MNLQRKILNRIRKNSAKGLPLSKTEFEEAKSIISILDSVSILGYSSDSLFKMFSGHPDYPPEPGITPYKEKIYELEGAANKGAFHIRIGSRSTKNRVRFRWKGRKTEILGVGNFHTKHSKNAN